MTDVVIDRRRRQRAALVDRVRQWAEVAGPSLGARAVVVVGSVARGDFNKWSDIDVLVVADGMPEELRDRLVLLATTQKPAGLEVIVWTCPELAARRAQGNDPIARDAYDVGVVVHGRLPE